MKARITVFGIALDKGLNASILLTDLSKAFDSISHELLIAKLHAYGFSSPALSLIREYLSDTLQWTKVGDTFSNWRRILFGFPQGSILGPLLCNIYLNDLFLSSPDLELANYVDGNSLFEYSDHVDAIVGKLEKYALFFIEWFERNYLVPNPSKWH